MESNRSVRIFLAEDNPADAFLLKEALAAHGIEHEIDRCADGEECVSRLTREAATLHPDLIIVDLNLPRVDGLEVLKSIRATSQFDAVPVMVLTSSQSPRDRQNAYEYGADAFVSKPPRLDDFLAAVGSSVATILQGRPRRDLSGRCGRRATVRLRQRSRPVCNIFAGRESYATRESYSHLR